MLLTTYCNAHSSSTHPVLHSLLACLAPEQPVFCTACRLSWCCSVFPFLNLFSLVVFVRLFVPDIGYLCFPLSFLLALLFYDGIYLDIDYPCKISRSLCFRTPLRSFFITCCRPIFISFILFLLGVIFPLLSISSPWTTGTASYSVSSLESWSASYSALLY